MFQRCSLLDIQNKLVKMWRTQPLTLMIILLIYISMFNLYDSFTEYTTVKKIEESCLDGSGIVNGHMNPLSEIREGWKI